MIIGLCKKMKFSWKEKKLNLYSMSDEKTLFWKDLKILKKKSSYRRKWYRKSDQSKI